MKFYTLDHSYNHRETMFHPPPVTFSNLRI